MKKPALLSALSAILIMFLASCATTQTGYTKYSLGMMKAGYVYTDQTMEVMATKNLLTKSTDINIVPVLQTWKNSSGEVTYFGLDVDPISQLVNMMFQTYFPSKNIALHEALNEDQSFQNTVMNFPPQKGLTVFVMITLTPNSGNNTWSFATRFLTRDENSLMITNPKGRDSTKYLTYDIYSSYKPWVEAFAVHSGHFMKNEHNEYAVQEMMDAISVSLEKWLLLMSL